MIIGRRLLVSSEYRLILTSRGLNTEFGTSLIDAVYKKKKMKYGRIFLVLLPYYDVDEIIEEVCRKMGFTEIYLSENYKGVDISQMPDVDAVYVTEGNTFMVAKYCRDNGFDEYIRKMVLDGGATYIGSSAGAIYASNSFEEACNFDSNDTFSFDYTGLKLLPGNEFKSDTVIPHYSFTQLQTYIKDFMSPTDIAKYGIIYNVSNEEALILDCICDESGNRELGNHSRIRLL